MAFNISKKIGQFGRVEQYESMDAIRAFDIQAPGLWGQADTLAEAILVASEFGPEARIMTGFGEDTRIVPWTYQVGSC